MELEKLVEAGTTGAFVSLISGPISALGTGLTYLLATNGKAYLDGAEIAGGITGAMIGSAIGAGLHEYFVTIPHGAYQDSGFGLAMFSIPLGMAGAFAGVLSAKVIKYLTNVG